MDNGSISEAMGPKILQKILESGLSPEQIVAQEGLRPPEENDLVQMIDQALADDPKTVKRYREGNDKVLNRLIGIVMKQAQGRADAKRVRTLLVERADAL
jgi:aspartyl-tRNA(Asn)/glutamyl-tRNA(Gln) amidotransferase subunit B